MMSASPWTEDQVAKTIIEAAPADPLPDLCMGLCVAGALAGKSPADIMAMLAEAWPVAALVVSESQSDGEVE